jgi:PAS domain S-box-containing protein
MAESIVESSAETVLNVAKAEAIRVLHVDDDQMCQKVAKQCLDIQGKFEVDTASSVNEALEKLKKTDYDVIVSDYQMPGKDGFELLKELRGEGNTVPFIVFTGKGREEIAMKALNLGASGYFTKQGEPDTVYGELAHGIRQAIERKRAEARMWEREERLRAIFGSSPDAVAVSDLHGNIVDCNEAAWKMLGFSSKEELIGKSSLDFIAQKDRQKAYETLKKSREGGATRNLEYTLLNKDGEESWGELSVSIMKDSSGNPSGFVSIMRDITERKKAEQTLKKSEEEYRSLVELASDGILSVNAEGIITSANRSFLTLLGCDSEEVVGKPFTELKTSRLEDIPRMRELFMSLMKGESPSPVEFLYVRRDGTSRWAEVHPGLFVKDGNPVGAHVIMRDVTERKKVEEEKSRLLHDLHQRVKELNCFYGMSRLVEKSDISLDDVLQGTANLLPPAMQYPDSACARIVVETREFSAKNFEETRWKLQADIKVLGEKVGSVEVCYLEEQSTIAEDPFLKEERLLIDAVAERLGKIIERKKAEQASKESEEKSRSIVETSSDQIFMLDRDCRFLSINKTGADIFNISPPETVGKSMSEVFPEKIAAQFSKNIKNVFDTGKSMHMDEKMVIEGRELYSSTSLNPVRDDSGRVIAVTGIVRDITERKKGEKRLQESEERFRAIFEGANDGILVADVKTKRFSLANPRICEITGYSLEELLKLSVGDIHPKKDLPHVVDSFTKLVQGKLTLAKGLPVLRKDEKVVYCDISARSVKIGSQEYLIGLFRDVTERKKTEQTLRASLERYQSFIEVTGELGWTTNADGEVVEDTLSFRKFSGQTYEEVKGWGWSKALHPDDVERVTQIWKEATRTKSKYETEFRLRRHDGVYRYFMARSVPLLNEDGSIREWVGTCIDITDLKDVEEHLKEMNMKLEVTNEKLHVVGSLARHDVNNKLSAVTGYAYLLKKKHADQVDIVEGLGMIEQAVKEVGRIFDFARVYEQLGVEELAYVAVEKTLDEAAALFSGLTIKVVNRCHGLTVLADSFLRQLFYNFIDNTRKYGGKVTAIRVHYEKAESGKLLLVCEDDGVGISAENKLKLFTEGFSTGGSTGFGLFLIRKMMDVYGWQIQETGELGKGAKFVITIPEANLKGKENYQLS